MAERQFLKFSVVGDLSVGSVFTFHARSRKRYVVDTITSDFVFAHEMVRNGDILFVPSVCSVVERMK